MKPKYLPIFMLLAAITRIYPLWSYSLWYDENFTYLVSRLAPDNLLLATAADVHPPLYYLIISLFTHNDLPSWIIRIPSAVFSILAVLVVWFILNKWESRYLTAPVKYAAMLLVVFNPQQIYYAQEGRMYALLTLLVCLCWLTILYERPVLTYITGALILFTHNYGLFYLACLGSAGFIYQYWYPDHYKLRIVLGNIVTPVVGAYTLYCITWLPIVLKQMGSIAGSYWMLYFTPGSTLYDLHSSYFTGSTLEGNLLNIVTFYILLLFTMGYIYMQRKVLPIDLPLLLLSMGTWILAVIGSLVFQPIMLFRALVPMGLFLCILFAVPVSYLLEHRYKLWIALIMVLPAMVTNFASYYRSPEFIKS